ncbi:MAG: hypothetical protein AB1730_11080 [Myxococcota bacterium]
MSARVRFLSMAAAAVAVMSASGCVCVTNGASRGDVTFLWSFNGRQCALVPNVTQVTIQIPGQTLQNGGVYPCVTQGTAGITLLNFRAGTYSYSIQGRNNAGAVLYEASGSFVVDGNVTVTVDLAPSPNAPGAAAITWRFPPSSAAQQPTCNQAEGPIVAVLIRVDGDTVGQEFNCADGDIRANPAIPGVIFPNLTVGTHTVDLAARDINNFYYYRKVSTFTVVAGGTTDNEFTFDWGVGALPMKWTFNNGVTQVDCAQAGITSVTVQLRDSAQNDLYPGAGVQVPCQTGGVQGTRFPFLYPDTYRVYLQATGTGGVLYSTNFNTPPTAAVSAGQFPAIDVSTQTFVMTP